MDYGSAAICLGVIAFFSVAVYFTRKKPFPREYGNDPKVYRYRVIAEYVDAAGNARPACPDQEVTVTIGMDPGIDEGSRHAVIYRGPISWK